MAASPSPPAHARPVLFPPLPDGRREWRDERDVAPYLSAWKAARLRAARAARTAMTPNQGDYDARTYDLDLRFDPAAETIAGTVRMRATVVHGPLATLDLDLVAAMIVDSVSAEGHASGSTRDGDVLTVSLGRPVATGETVEIGVAYHGTPPRTGPFAGAFGFRTVYGRTLIWSLSEPYGARAWWPCKDVPGDKADSVDIRYTVPGGLITASNGSLVASSDDGRVAVTRWHERHPIATYLVSIASYPYTVSHDVYHDAPGDSMPIDFYNFPESVPAFAPGQAKVKDMLAAFAARFGPYPFRDEKYGHAEFMFGGGMEHQTCTSLGSPSEWVMAHELSHQWWGDDVTCRDFHHIWLNEGFATYAQALWDEAGGGLAAYLTTWAAHPFYGPGTVFVPDTTDEARIFDSGLSYLKGSWVLHMLRHVMGDTRFFAALREYGTRFGGGTASTEDLRDVCERVSGLDLHRFFEQWVYGEYYPIYRPTWTSRLAPPGFDVTLRLDQIQSWQLFRMPVDIRIALPGGDRTLTVEDSLASQTFTFHVPAAPLGLTVDPDHWVLRQVDQPVTAPAFDRPLLLVNDADAYGGAPQRQAFADSAYTGTYPFDFWDTHPVTPPASTAGLPTPIGQGEVPAFPLGRYRNVVWVGGTDTTMWAISPMRSYLEAGGNVLLLTSAGAEYLGDSLRAALGIGSFIRVDQETWYATLAGYRDLPMLAGQFGWSADGFETPLARRDAKLWFRSPLAVTPPIGTGVIGPPMAGVDTSRPGGRLAYLAGGPWFWEHPALRADVDSLLRTAFGEPLPGAGGGAPPVGPPSLQLSAPAPNPFVSGVTVRLQLGSGANVRAVVRDVAGRAVRTLLDAPLAAGEHPIPWDGRDDDGRVSPAGLYWLDLHAGGVAVTRRFVRLP